MNQDPILHALYMLHRHRDHDLWRDYDRAVSWVLTVTKRGSLGEASTAALDWALARRDDYQFGGA